MKKVFQSLIVGLVCVVMVQLSVRVHAAKYEYDKLNRLIKVTYENGSYIEYEYDKNGNIKNVNQYVASLPIPTPTVIPQPTATIPIASEKPEPDKLVITVIEHPGGYSELRFNAIEGAEQYAVYRSSEEYGTYTLVKYISETVFIDQSIFVSGKNYYKIKPCFSNPAIKSEFSNIVGTIRLNDITENDITLLSSLKTGAAYNEVLSYHMLKWSSVTNADSYEIYRSTSLKGGFKKIDTIKNVDNIKYIDKTIKSNKKYFYKVRAVASVTGIEYHSKYSSVMKCSWTKSTPPSGVKINNISKDIVKISWKKALDADDYVIYQSASKYGTYRVKSIIWNSKDNCFFSNVNQTGNQYYIICAFKKVNGKILFSNFSEIIEIK
ncbi:fibronectin type III domain-containing protein [Anaeromicropila populeti]|uniref:YD repeat-containing protein n=1 Tax=Anaeromicropila populeti TaxID=37658 RepID=A0A1I6LH61_9FIRM|nr:hypothetical protein [Anaeromicropila populeti]SFS02754.1 YD repeat-containing protein [Anaeromicropila populeti]